MNSFTVHLSSEQSVGAASDFTVTLPRQLELQGKWQCCLHDFQCSKRPVKTGAPLSILVCADMCSASFVNDKSLPVLASIPVKYQLKSPLVETYVPLRADDTSLSTIRIFLADETGRLSSFELGRVKCSVHFKRDGEYSPVDKTLF